METLNTQNKSKVVSWIMLGIVFIGIAIFHFFHEPSWLLFAIMGVGFMIRGMVQFPLSPQQTDTVSHFGYFNYNDNTPGKWLFVSCLFLGMGIGKFLGFTSEGLFIGMGIGFFLRALFPLLSTNKEV